MWKIENCFEFKSWNFKLYLKYLKTCSYNWNLLHPLRNYLGWFVFAFFSFLSPPNFQLDFSDVLHKTHQKWTFKIIFFKFVSNTGRVSESSNESKMKKESLSSNIWKNIPDVTDKEYSWLWVYSIPLSSYSFIVLFFTHW